MMSAPTRSPVTQQSGSTSPYAAAEIADQPSAWARAATLAGEERTRQALPRVGERVAVVGCGTSFFMGQSFAIHREESGHGETDVFPASEFPRGRSYDAVVVLTRSGTTTEVLRLLQHLNSGGPRPRTVVITADPATPVMQLTDHQVVLDFADERSVVQTRFATTSVALWRAWLGEDLDNLISEASAALVEPRPARALTSTQFTFLGAGASVGIANEAALKVREASQSWAESYPAMEFRHGPISVIDRSSTVWLFGETPPGLMDDLQVTGGHVMSSDRDPLADLIRAQRLAVALAEVKGLNPDTPRNLTRSVLLAGADRP